VSTESADQNIQREVMEADVVIVGGGAAGLSAAISLMDQIAAHNERVNSGKSNEAVIQDPMVIVLEKASEVGAHSFSGAVLDPCALKELIPDYVEKGCPLETPVSEEAVYYLAKKKHFKLPVVPPPFRNEGNFTISLSKFNRWLASIAESKGVNIFPGFVAVEALYDEQDNVIGVQTGDKGRDKDGKPKENFEPGLIIKSKVTIFAEGTRGSLFKHVATRLNLYEGKNPDVYEEGVKEIIQMPKGTVKAGQVIHTLGFPLSKSIGGTFIYTLPEDRIVVGLVGYLDTRDPLFDPHKELQRLKTHPFIYKMIEGGQVVAYGGKTLPAGGWYSMPRLYHGGMLVCGDSASMVDVQKLKGIHLAMKSGMLAAETAIAALAAGDYSRGFLYSYEQKVHASYIKKQLYRVRNFHQTLGIGIFESMPLIALQEITGGRGLTDKMAATVDRSHTEPLVEVWGAEGANSEDALLPKPDGKLFFDKLSSVYLTGTQHDENSPNHLKVSDTSVCSDVCYEKFHSPCNHFCPANVYEMVPVVGDEEKKRLQVNYTNCIHCQTCDLKCPFDNIDWTAPEGGGGPQYTET